MVADTVRAIPDLSSHDAVGRFNYNCPLYRIRISCTKWLLWPKTVILRHSELARQNSASSIITITGPKRSGCACTYIILHSIAYVVLASVVIVMNASSSSFSVVQNTPVYILVEQQSVKTFLDHTLFVPGVLQ